MDEIKDVARRFNRDISEVERIVKSGVASGLTVEAALVGARLALSMTTGKHEYFSLEDVETALGLTREEALAQLEEMGVAPVKITTAPGFEWLLN